MRLKVVIAGLNAWEWWRRGRGHQGVFRVDRRRSAIVLVVFRRVSLSIVKLWNFELVDAGEKHSWSCEFDELALHDLVRFLQFAAFSCKVWLVGRDRG